jgi:hypothetical protein
MSTDSHVTKFPFSGERLFASKYLFGPPVVIPSGEAAEEARGPTPRGERGNEPALVGRKDHLKSWMEKKRIAMHGKSAIVKIARQKGRPKFACGLAGTNRPTLHSLGTRLGMELDQPSQQSR